MPLTTQQAGLFEFVKEAQKPTPCKRNLKTKNPHKIIFGSPLEISIANQAKQGRIRVVKEAYKH